MVFSVGDKVKIVDEQSEGEIIRIDKTQIWVSTDLGFDFPYYPHQLIKLTPSGENVYSPKKFQFPATEKKIVEKGKWVFPKIHLHKKGVPEVDLHLEELIERDSQISHHEKMEYQLAYLQEVLSRAREQKVRRLIIIHGVGEGVLRSAIKNLLVEAYPDVESLDADYSKYGYGATEIIIHGLYR